MTLRVALPAFLFTLGLAGAQQPAVPLLFQATRNADTAALKDVLRRGVNPNEKDADGTPALMEAILYADADSLRLLLDHGASANAVNGDGATALIWAIPNVESGYPFGFNQWISAAGASWASLATPCQTPEQSTEISIHIAA